MDCLAWRLGLCSVSSLTGSPTYVFAIGTADHLLSRRADYKESRILDGPRHCMGGFRRCRQELFTGWLTAPSDKTKYGVLGGLIGAGMGGMVFDPISFAH